MPTGVEDHSVAAGICLFASAVPRHPITGYPRCHENQPDHHRTNPIAPTTAAMPANAMSA